MSTAIQNIRGRELDHYPCPIRLRRRANDFRTRLDYRNRTSPCQEFAGRITQHVFYSAVGDLIPNIKIEAIPRAPACQDSQHKPTVSLGTEDAMFGHFVPLI